MYLSSGAKYNVYFNIVLIQRIATWANIWLDCFLYETVFPLEEYKIENQSAIEVSQMNINAVIQWRSSLESVLNVKKSRFLQQYLVRATIVDLNSAVWE